MSARRAGGRLATWLLAAGFGLAVVRAQEQVVVHAVDGQQVCSAKVRSYAGARQCGGFGYVLVDLLGHDNRPHAVQVEYASMSYGSSDLRVRRRIDLGPNERSRFCLPLPNTMESALQLRLTIDGTTYYEDLLGPHAAGLVGLMVTERPQLLPAGLEVMQAAPSTASDPPTLELCSGADLPPDWRWLTGFHLVVVDGRTALDGLAQETLRRYLHAGGRLVVAAADRLPAGALRDVCGAVDAAGVLAHGLGLCAVIPPFGGDTTAMRAQLDKLPRLGLGVWPLPDAMLAPQPIPGLGRAPVLAFLLVILVFAVAVGPVNFFLLRRWRRPMLALLTVPALGFGTTLVMLGYGLFHDGFGVRGVVRSWSLLDQSRHEAVAIAARTLFAGLAPNALTMQPDTLLVAPAVFAPVDRRRASRWYFDADTSGLDGGVLASRTTTPLFTGQQGTARQRLRVRQRGDGGLDVLTDGGVQPTGQLLLCGPDGGYWVGQGAVLQACPAAVAEAALENWRRAASVLPVWDPEDGGAVKNIDGVVACFVGGRGLAPGSYVTTVAAPAWLEEHGLDVAYDQAEHFVAGRLGAEDFVR